MDKNTNRKLWFIPQTQNPNALMNLFCFHHAGGSASFYNDWPQLLTPYVNLLTIQLPGRDARYLESFITDIHSVIKELSVFFEIFEANPFALFGHSLGSIIAFEVARELQRRSLPDPKALIISGHSAPGESNSHEKIYSLQDELFVQTIIKKYGGISDKIQYTPELIALFLPRLRADVLLFENYKYLPEKPLNCPIYIMNGAHDQSIEYENLSKWQNETQKKIKQFFFPGHHFFLVSEKINVLNKINKILETHLII